jgi:hypothetical protein
MRASLGVEKLLVDQPIGLDRATLDELLAETM